MSTKKTDLMKFYKKAKIANMQYLHEQEAWSNDQLICGVDEVGRGCFAGPVVVAAAILKPHSYHELLQDSKLLSKKELQTAYDWLMSHATFQLSTNTSTTIDQLNIYQATKVSMLQALKHFLYQQAVAPSKILVDAMPLSLENSIFSHIPIESYTKGESVSASIAAASIIAKVSRDRLITRMGKTFPGYGFEQHKGYGTQLHQKNIVHYQPSIIHRTTFLKKMLNNHESDQQSIFC